MTLQDIFNELDEITFAFMNAADEFKAQMEALDKEVRELRKHRKEIEEEFGNEH